MQTLSRRSFLRLGALAGAASLAAACQVPATPAPAAPPAEPAGAQATTGAPAAPASAGGESPMLAERVAAGSLPPVEERIPENPFVITGLDGIGNYGGTLRKSFSGQADGGTIDHMAMRGMLNINHEMVLHPYLVESWEVTSDATEYTFHLRKGLRWSDGEPMTAEDFRFYYEDFILNEELTAVVGQNLSSDVEGTRVAAEFSVLDDFTIRYKFALPKSLWPYSGIVTGILAHPAHYMKQFHKDYADADTLAAAIQEHSMDDWTQLYIEMERYLYHPERPLHMPWIPLNSWTDEIVFYERNPYFWEVDGEGNQLPYIDTLQFRAFSNVQIAVMWAASGEIDQQTRHINAWTNYTALKEGESVGDYTVQVWERSMVLGAFFNQTCKDPRVRELFQEKDFRIAISHCVNRDEMRELLLDGFGTNKQYTPPQSSPLYYEKLANAYLEYDLDKANALIDGLGYTERDSDGYRLWKDGSGERIRWTTTGSTPDLQQDGLLLVDYFEALGFEMNYRGMDRALSIELHDNNDIDCDVPAVMDYNLVPLAEP
ncbi:MAG: ABC transporter substrate-binding protein, partial [Chloroflexi bacterium]|nr:ABC transporter substrate-binding protein [Chloroflexota bacterium]